VKGGKVKKKNKKKTKKKLPATRAGTQTTASPAL
jgi:hypothetical protein